MLKRITGSQRLLILIIVGLALLSRFQEPKAITGFGAGDNTVRTFHVSSDARKM